MAYWLLKTEADTWSWDQQVKRGAKGEEWSGVRNHQAAKNMRAMKKGEYGFFYHTGDDKEIVGIVEVIREAYPDKTAEEGNWVAVDVIATMPFKTPVTLVDIRKDAKLKDMVLVKNSRLSVQPVTDAEWAYVCKLGGVKAP